MHLPLAHSLPALTLLAAIMTACGGDGGSSGGPDPVVVSPSPTPTPTPSPTPTSDRDRMPPAPYLAGVATEFDIFGWSIDPQQRSTVPIEKEGFALSWDGAGQYDIAIDGIGSGALRYTDPDDTRSYRLTIEQDDGTLLPVAIHTLGAKRLFEHPEVINWGYPANEAATTYEWTRAGIVVAGKATDPARLPRTGVVEYRVLETPAWWCECSSIMTRWEYPGSSDASITVDFGAETVSAAISLAWTDAWGPYAPWGATITAIRFAPDEAAMDGTFTIPDAKGESIYAARFFGPDAEYLALRIRAFLPDIYYPGYDQPFDYVLLLHAAE